MSVINLKNQTDLSGFYIVYKGSTLNEKPGNYGISHTMEHLLCKSFEHLYDDFDRYSINWNAYTSSNEVVFHMSGLDEYLYKYRHELLNSLLTFNITEEQFNTEREVVIQEYKDYFQDQESTHFYNILRKEKGYFGPIGELQSLEQLTYQDVKDYFEQYLSTPTSIINVSKHNDFSGYDNFTNEYPKIYTKKQDIITLEKPIEFNKSSIYGYRKIDDKYPYIKFINNMLSGSLKSPLYTELREKRGLCYSIGTFLYNISDGEGMFMTGIETTDTNVDTALDVYKDVLSNPSKYLTKERFNIVKDNLITVYKKNDINRHKNISKYITPIEWQLEPIIEQIKFDDIMDIYNELLGFDTITWSIDKKNEY